MKARGEPRDRPAKSRDLYPAYGRIEGGKLDGYGYAFLGVERRPNGELDVRVRVTPPDWPFPQEAYLTESGTEWLRRMPGSRVPRFDALEQVKRFLLNEAASIGLPGKPPA